jgi:hypothetical protein
VTDAEAPIAIPHGPLPVGIVATTESDRVSITEIVLDKLFAAYT